MFFIVLLYSGLIEQAFCKGKLQLMVILKEFHENINVSVQVQLMPERSKLAKIHISNFYLSSVWTYSITKAAELVNWQNYYHKVKEIMLAKVIASIFTNNFSVNCYLRPPISYPML